MLTWLAACIYTCGYAFFFGYGKEYPRLIWGIPEWIVWGIGVPWFACLAVTVWLSLWGIRDEDLGEEAGDAASHG